MGIGDKYNQFFHAIQTDTAQWGVINGLIEGESFSVLADVESGEETVVPVQKRDVRALVSDTFKKTIQEKVDTTDEMALKWLRDKNVKTRQHLHGLLQNLDDSDPTVLKK